MSVKIVSRGESIASSLPEAPCPVHLAASARMIDPRLRADQVVWVENYDDAHAWVRAPGGGGGNGGRSVGTSTAPFIQVPLGLVLPLETLNVDQCKALCVGAENSSQKRVPLLAPSERSLRDLILSERLHRTLREVEALLVREDELLAKARKLGRVRQPQRAILLTGPPGVGKTASVHALATSAGQKLVSLGAETKSSYMHMTERITMELAAISHHAKGRIAILMDDGDALVGKRFSGGHRHQESEIAAVIQAMEQYPSACFYITTNASPADIDGAILSRALVISFEMPTAEMRMELAKRIVAAGVLSSQDALHRIGDAEHLSMRDVERLLERLLLSLAIRGEERLSCDEVRAAVEASNGREECSTRVTGFRPSY